MFRRVMGQGVIPEGKVIGFRTDGTVVFTAEIDAESKEDARLLFEMHMIKQGIHYYPSATSRIIIEDTGRFMGRFICQLVLPAGNLKFGED